MASVEQNYCKGSTVSLNTAYALGVSVLAFREIVYVENERRHLPQMWGRSERR